MSEILIGQSYYLRFDPKLWQAMQPYPPLGAMYAASFVRQRGYEVGFFDAMLAASEREWQEALGRERPHVAVIYEDNFNYLSKMCLLRTRQAALRMIEMARGHGCTVIVAGSDATDHPDVYLAPGAHFVLIGEGEHTLAELLDVLTGRTGRPLESIRGLAYGNGKAGSALARADGIVRTARRDDITDLDALPFPAWDLVDVPRYRDIWHRHHGYYSMNMVTTRGCPYHCNWCAKPIWGQRYNARSPENVADELELLRERYAPDHIWFADDIMGLEAGWLQRFADLIEMRGLRVPFKCLNRVDLLLRDGEIEALARAGCQIAWIGAESGAQKILDAMEKGTRVEQIYEATERLHAAGVKAGFFLQFGYPGETRQDVERTLQMVRDCRPDDVGMSVSYPLPGTKFYERVKEELGSRQNWEDSSDLAMLYRGSFDTAFYRQLHTVLHKEFRARRYWAVLKQVGAGTEPPKKGHLRQAVAMTYHAATLPLARRHLDRLARVSHEDSIPLPPGLDPQGAAMPSPQHEGPDGR
jgi:anaerobic magnesium-protoporphyrin IX monomethyl ester cyclase